MVSGSCFSPSKKTIKNKTVGSLSSFQAPRGRMAARGLRTGSDGALVGQLRGTQRSHGAAALQIQAFLGRVYVGLSENRVYSQWNSHLIGIMISKTIGFFGVHDIFRHTHVEGIWCECKFQCTSIIQKYVVSIQHKPTGFEFIYIYICVFVCMCLDAIIGGEMLITW